VCLRFARVLLAVLLATANWTARADTPAEEFLRSLAAEIHRSRSAPAPDTEGPKGPTPELNLLIGLPSGRLRAAFGEPDFCSLHHAGSCATPGEWRYILDPGPAGWLGGGGRVLVLAFDTGTSCTSAKWQFSR
jgi:hypothetical protein